MSEPTFCDTCQHHREAKHPAHDYCMMHPRLEGFGWVRQTQWDTETPFLKCHAVNGGACPLYQLKTEQE